MYYSTSSLFALLCALPSALAHGYVRDVLIDGQKYPGLRPQAKGDTVVRTISSSFPINDVNDLSTNCGIEAYAASQVAEAKPGSTITFDWAGGDDGKWPHNTGPILDYIASCEGSCAEFDSQRASWLKFAQVGRKGKGQPWVQQDLFEGKTYSAKLPADLPNGEYLIRHEVIGLHIANNRKGVEMYPSCIQIRVTGGKDGSLPTGGVKFPGTYKQDDPGLLITNQFDSNAEYPFPGPEIADFGSGAHPPAATTRDGPSATPTGPSATVTEDGPTSTVTSKNVQPTKSASSSDAPTPTGGDPPLVTVTEYVTVTEEESTSATPTSTVFRTVTVTANVGPATTTAAYGGYDEYAHRARRSRIFGKRSGH